MPSGGSVRAPLATAAEEGSAECCTGGFILAAHWLLNPCLFLFFNGKTSRAGRSSTPCTLHYTNTPHHDDMYLHGRPVLPHARSPPKTCVLGANLGRAWLSAAAFPASPSPRPRGNDYMNALALISFYSVARTTAEPGHHDQGPCRPRLQREQDAIRCVLTHVDTVELHIKSAPTPLLAPRLAAVGPQGARARAAGTPVQRAAAAAVTSLAAGPVQSARWWARF